MTRGDDDLNTFAPLPTIHPDPSLLPYTTSTDITTGKADHADDSSLTLTEEDTAILALYINPQYLKPETIHSVNELFCEQSSLQLKDFLNVQIADKIKFLIDNTDQEENLGNGHYPELYSVGTSDRWIVKGSSHKRRYLQYQAPDSDTLYDEVNAYLASTSTEDRADKGQLIGSILSLLQHKLFQHPVFTKYLRVITELVPTSYRSEVRRFRPGLDYTVAHYGGMTKEPRLDATLCFVKDDYSSGGGGVAAGANVATSDGDDDDEEEGEDEGPWSSGDVGGFECYIEAEEGDDNAEAAEVFQSSYSASSSKKWSASSHTQDAISADEHVHKKAKTTASATTTATASTTDNGEYQGAGDQEDGHDDEDDDDDDDEESESSTNKGEDSTSLLSISPGFNVLNLVMRDDRVMRFIKYVSANAPSSRYDVSVEYEYNHQVKE